MRRGARAVGLATVLVAATALAVSGARADTFAVVSSTSPTTPALLDQAPVQPEQLSMTALESLWMRAGATYGIPWQVLAAINKVESNFGRNMGPSSAGAIGWMQFMPSTWLRWGVDANGDGVADPWNPDDAIFSAARYLAAAGGQTDLSRAVFAYNHADWYVNEVLGLAGAYGSGGVDVVFTLDKMQQRLDEARKALALANRVRTSAVAVEHRLSRAETRLLDRAEHARLLTERAVARQQAVLLDLRLEDAQARSEQSSRRLALARAALRAAQADAKAAAFNPTAATLLSAPSFGQGDYVFPVGGGPSVVSVAHTHHDYPAADIAAPMGAPVYALTNSVVMRSWAAPDGNCGIGLTLRAADGREWTYCHLSYLDPTVQPGMSLAAGASVGLVGMTGDATGPHLHLQLDPALSYPQDEAWFQSFAGTAFRWQDASTPGLRSLASVAAPSGPVFAVMSSAPVFERVVEFTR
jgi:murein DD-endopeptidase MepM/ murein hydrolase activator NlpD